MGLEVILGSSILVSGIVGWMGSMQKRLNALNHCQADSRERLASLEATASSTNKSIFDRLDKIDHKLDRILINGKH